MSEAEIILQDDISVSILDDVEIVSGGDNVVVVSSTEVIPGPPWAFPVMWETDTIYIVTPVTSLVTHDGSVYACLLPHTSGVFSDDLVAGKWLLFIAKGVDGIDGDIGPQGEQGETGAQGPQGVSGTDVCGMYGGTIVESHSGNAVTFAVKTRSGANPSSGTPVVFAFQNGSGGIDFISVTASLSITVPSSATLGTSNDVAFRLWIAAFNDAGTVRLAVKYPTPQMGTVDSSSDYLPEGTAASATQPPGNLSRIFYSESVAITSKYWCWIAYATYESGIATAGTWDASPTVVVLVGPTTPRPGTLLKTVVGNVGAGNYNGNDAWTIPSIGVTITPFSAANQLEVTGNCVYIYLRSLPTGGLAGAWTMVLDESMDNLLLWGTPQGYSASTGVDGPMFPGGAENVFIAARTNSEIAINYAVYCSSSSLNGVNYAFNAMVVKEYMG